MGAGRLKGEQLRDNTISGQEMADNSLEPRHVTEPAADKALSFTRVYFPKTLPDNIILASPAQSFAWPSESINVVSDVDAGLINDAIAMIATVEKTSTRAVIDETDKRLLITNRVADNDDIIASDFGSDVEITYTSPGVVGNSLNLKFDGDVSEFSLGGGGAVSAATGYLLLKDSDATKFIVIKVNNVPVLPGLTTVSVAVNSGAYIGVFDLDSLPIELDADTYPALYPSIQDLSTLPPETFFELGGAISVGPAANTLFNKTEALVHASPVTASARDIGVITGVVNLPASVTTDAEAKKLVSLYINGEKQPLARYTYAILTQGFTWNFAVGDDPDGFDIDTDDDVEAYFPTIIN